eukprot:sb/3465794/
MIPPPGNITALLKKEGLYDNTNPPLPGNITALLKEEGLYDNTLIVFTSDNGANVGYCKTTSYTGENPEGREPGSNFPFRGGKRSVFEGGIRLVSFVHGPGLIRNPGRISSDMVHLVDWYPTFEEIVREYDTTHTGTYTDNTYGLHQTLSKQGRGPTRQYITAGYNATISDPPVTSPKDGISFWRVLKKALPGKRRSFLININKRGSISCGPTKAFKAIRSGNWKLIVGVELTCGFDMCFELENYSGAVTLTVCYLGGGGPPKDWFHPYKETIQSGPLNYYQLYHIKNDPYETTNVAEIYPTMVLQLLHELAELEHTMVPSRKRKKEDLTSRIWNGTVPTPLQPSLSNELMYTGNVWGSIHDVDVVQVVQKP